MLPRWGDIGGIGVEVTLVTLSRKGRWWHSVGRDVGVPKVGDIGGIGLEMTMVALGLK